MKHTPIKEERGCHPACDTCGYQKLDSRYGLLCKTENNTNHVPFCPFNQAKAEGK